MTSLSPLCHHHATIYLSIYQSHLFACHIPPLSCLLQLKLNCHTCMLLLPPKNYCTTFAYSPVPMHLLTQLSPPPQEELYHYESPVLSPTLPAPNWEELEEGGYLNHVRRASPQAVAGGYTEHYACLRALQDFMSSHFLS